MDLKRGCYDITRANEQNVQMCLDLRQLFATPLSDKAWKLCLVEPNAIEEEDSSWATITSTPGIYLLGKRLDGYYEVVVDESYIPWLVRHELQFFGKAEFELLLGYDPMKATNKETQVHGWGRFYLRFLENAFKAIWSRNSQGLRLCLRSNTPPGLQAAIEWAVLSHDIVAAKPEIRDKLILCILLLALNLNKDDNNCSVIKLLKKDQNEVLKAFRKEPADLLQESAKWKDREAHLQFVGLVQRVFVISSGQEGLPQLELNQEYTAFENLNFLGCLVSIQGANYFGNFDTQAMLNALRRSKAIDKEKIDAIGIAELGRIMAATLPIKPKSAAVFGERL